MAARKKERAVSETELRERVVVLRRFRELLLQQRERFRTYLASLEKQQAAIESGNAQEILAHVELEEQIVADLFSIQKVIDPLEDLYNSTAGSAASVSPADDVLVIKNSLDDLKHQAAARFAHNRELLSLRMADIRTEITSLRDNPFTKASRSRSSSSATASLIDIEG